ESAGHAGRIYDRLRERFGRERVFMDVSAIEPGVDFVEAIDRAVGSCTVLLVIIGRKWFDCSDAAGRRRLEDTADFIRLEVGTALKRNIRVIPVLVQDAGMPKEADLPDDLKLLARRHAIEINDTHWDTDLAQLVETLGRILEGTAETVPTGGANTKPLSGVQKNRLTWLISSVTALLLALTGLLTGVESFRNSFVRLFKGSPQVTTTTGSPSTGSNTHPTDRGPKIPATDSAPATDTQQEPAPPILINVPNLAGKSLDSARAALGRVGLLAGEVEKRETGDMSPNTVVAQSPKAGTKLTKGKKVNLVVTVKAPEAELVTVPNVVRQPLERAVRILTEAGLRPGTETLRPTDKSLPGMVLNQKLKAGATARRGTAVDLLVSAPQAAGGSAGDTPAAQKVLARGNLEVHQTYLFDLDSGKIVRNGDADFWFEAVTETERYLTPRNGAVIGLTREKTTYESCSQVKMTERRIPIQRVAENYYACVRTSHGNLASFKLREPVGPSPGVMKISYITWERAR
ncbi:MAG: PASTA domain-containing protein, partial [Deltaproteobacteria bacterium]|nr:PASTA domain-containing protein [Deltaproteobacteria bacterium]